MHFITSVYGNEYVPLLMVCLDSIKKEHPEDKVTILWDDINDFEVSMLKNLFSDYNFVKQSKGIHTDNILKRIPLKLRFWSSILEEIEDEVICFIDSDTLIYKNFSSQIPSDFDFIYTYKDERFPLNVGVVIVKNSKKIVEFLKEWLAKTESIVEDPNKLEYAFQTNGAADQQALMNLMNVEDITKGVVKDFGKGDIKFVGISCNILNQTNSVPVNSGSYIFHYKGGWRPILLKETGYTENRNQKDSQEMHYLWEDRYKKVGEEMLSRFVIQAAKKNITILDWNNIDYEERGILHSEMLAVISSIKEGGIEVIIESGRARGQSTKMLAQAFQNQPVKIISVELLKDEAAIFAEENLKEYKNIDLRYGDSNIVIPEILTLFKDKKVALLFDGPKGKDAYNILAQVIIDNPNILLAFFHDCRKSSQDLPNPSREDIYPYFDRLFFTDDLTYIENFSSVDKKCLPKNNNINDNTWRPYLKGKTKIGSYGPTMGIVMPSERDRERAKKNLVDSPNIKNNLLNETNMKSLAKKVIKKVVPRSIIKALRSDNSNIALNNLGAIYPSVIPNNHLSMGWTTKERERILELSLIYLGSSHIIGDYAEFGVWRGDTLATAYHFTKAMSSTFKRFEEMNFHAFDSFEGFPQLSDIDKFPQFKTGGRYCSEEEFMKFMNDKNVDMGKLRVTKGWFNKTLTKESKAWDDIKDESLSLAWIDCDLYESTIDVLEFVKSKMIPGGLMIFDDWFCFAGNPTKGEQKAVVEFLDKYKDVALSNFRKFHWHGNSFIFNKLTQDEVKHLREHGLVL